MSDRTSGRVEQLVLRHPALQVLLLRLALWSLSHASSFRRYQLTYTVTPGASGDYHLVMQVTTESFGACHVGAVGAPMALLGVLIAFQESFMPERLRADR